MTRVWAGVGVFTCGFSAAASAAPPQPFDAWTIDKGAIAASCASGMTCTTLGAGPGFLQRSIQNASGQSFIQTIIAPGNATGVPASGLGFSDESFVRGLGAAAAPLGDGLADKQIITQRQDLAGSTMLFDSRATILSGWAAVPGQPNVDITQTINASSPTEGNFSSGFRYTAGSGASSLEATQNLHDDGLVFNDEFDNVFHLTMRGDGKGDTTGSRLAVSQNVGMAFKTSTLELGQQREITAPTVGAFDTDERQQFVLRRSSGTMATGDILWIYNWQAAGLDPRQNAPLRSTWFGCLTTGTFAGVCARSDKHLTFELPALPFDPLPFAAPRAIHGRDEDRPLYPSVANRDKGGIVMASPGRQTGGNVIAGTDTIDHPSAPPAPPNGAPTITLEKWSVAAGKITAACPTGFGCKTLVADNGFLQMEILHPATGMTFYRTIMTDRGATGNASTLAFATDTVVRQSNSQAEPVATGVSAVNIVRDGPDSMDVVTRLDLGWARSGSAPQMSVNQSSPAGTFAYLANLTPTGQRSGFRMAIDQVDRDITERADTQFYHVAIAGDMLTQAGSAPLPGRHTTTWQAGDYISGTFIDQKNNFRGGGHDPDRHDGSLAWNLNQNWGGPAVTFAGYENFSDSQPRAGLIAPKTSVWWLWPESVFGPLPAGFFD